MTHRVRRRHHRCRYQHISCHCCSITTMSIIIIIIISSSRGNNGGGKNPLLFCETSEPAQLLSAGKNCPLWRGFPVVSSRDFLMSARLRKVQHFHVLLRFFHENVPQISNCYVKIDFLAVGGILCTITKSVKSFVVTKVQTSR